MLKKKKKSTVHYEALKQGHLRAFSVRLHRTVACNILKSVLTPSCALTLWEVSPVGKPFLHSTRGGLHHRFVTGMTESESHAGGRTRNGLSAGLLGVRCCCFSSLYGSPCAHVELEEVCMT